MMPTGPVGLNTTGFQGSLPWGRTLQKPGAPTVAASGHLSEDHPMGTFHPMGMDDARRTNDMEGLKMAQSTMRRSGGLTLPPTHQHSMIASKEAEVTMPFRTTRSLGGVDSQRPLPPLTPSPRNRFLVHYSEDASTGAAAADLAWRNVTSPRVLESIQQVEQYGQEHTSRVQKLQAALANQSSLYRHSASKHSVSPRFRGRASNTMLYHTAVLQ